MRSPQSTVEAGTPTLTWHEPSGDARAVLVIAPAMGTRQDYYAPFADYLASRGILVGTFDYRDSGFNQPANLAASVVTMRDWHHDLDAAIDAAAKRAPDVPRIVCGHSLGGQLLGVIRNRQSVDAMMTVASGTGYWRHNPRMFFRLLYLWFFAMPVYTRAFGYFPGRRFGKVGDLPKHIALAWSRWCRHPEYLLGDAAMREIAGYHEVSAPVLSFSFSDDTYIPKPAIEQLHGWFTGAQVTCRHLTPPEAGAKSVGHFGFFKLGHDHALWREAADWLLRQGRT
ncbi:MAG: alpha/beta hydrolase [Betaproteobacteria bacterium]|nr:alpha/beta hydrolase [Betaproteobacteria bacterium]